LKIPKSFILGNVTWDVKYPYELPEDRIGECEHYTAEIRLADIKKRCILEQTYCHEVIHAILYSMGFSDNHDEEFVDSFSVFLHQYLNQHGS
jgi:hypothetical protein